LRQLLLGFLATEVVPLANRLAELGRPIDRQWTDSYSGDHRLDRGR
jgi:hypothetical protein